MPALLLAPPTAAVSLSSSSSSSSASAPNPAKKSPEALAALALTLATFDLTLPLLMPVDAWRAARLADSSAATRSASA